MRKICFAGAAAIFGLSVAAQAAEAPNSRAGVGQQSPPTVPPASGATSSDLSRSGGVITPPSGIDPEMKQSPPPTGATMPVIPPPGTPGGNPAVKPK
ncbi:MAG: hypothetical protein JOY83_20750 [Alphaproteobacteria bacterium]|nr:hypothetical protein [Alphaproteobacteria bacterium]